MMKFEKLYRILHNQLKTNLGHSYGSLARIFSYSKVYMKLIIVGNVAMILESLLSILLPVYIGKILDVMKGEDSTANLRSVVHELTIVLFANVILMLARETSFDLLSIKVVRTMRLELFKSLLHKDIEFYDQNKSGDLLSRLTGDIEKVQNSSTNDVTLFVRKIFEIVASLFFVIYISPKLTLILLGFIPVKVFLLGLTGKTTRSNAMLIRTAVADANASANEVFLNIRVIKAFSTEDKEYNLYENKLASTYKLEIYSLFIGLGVFVVRVVLGFGGLLYLIWLGGSMVANQELSPGHLSTFIMCGLNASRGFNSIDRIIKRCAESLGACDRIFEVLDYQPRIKLTADEGITKDKLIGTVGVKDLSFAYPTKNDVTVLKHLDVDIPKGETIALVGASGSGKSTFTNLLQRFYDVSKGEVLIDGENITKYNLKWLHRQIGYVPQEPSLFSGTIEENIAYGVENYTQEDLQHAIEMSNATFVYDKQQFPLGLQTKVGERGTKLSGGQKQRIAIARAVIKNPKILIFDEATSALDAESEHQVQKAVELLMEEGGKTLIIIAHRLSTIINCKRILVFEQGNIVEQGNHKTLLSKEGVYKNLVERQLAGFDAESPRIVRS